MGFQYAQIATHTESGTQELIGNDNANWFFTGKVMIKLFGNGGNNDTLLGGKDGVEIKVEKVMIILKETKE